MRRPPGIPNQENLMRTGIESEEKRNHVGGTCAVFPDLSKAVERLAAGVEDVKAATRHFTKRARHATEDAVGDFVHRVKRYPAQSLGVAFGAGAVLGMALGGLCRKGGRK
jgi:hypothetical protein